MKSWRNVSELVPKKFKCKYCEVLVGSKEGYFLSGTESKIYICPNCSCATFFDASGNQHPSPIFGNTISNLPSEIDTLYNEARACIGVKAYTASVLACRKLLMNIAVEKGAKRGESFVKYVEYLSNKGYISPDGKDWVDHIRKKGNEANHEIALMSEKDATDLISFNEMLLKVIFEFPSKIKSKPNNNES